MSGQVGKGRIVVLRLPPTGQTGKALSCERVSRIHRSVWLSDHLHLNYFPELANHVSTTTNLTMIWKKKNQELAFVPSRVLHSAQ